MGITSENIVLFIESMLSDESVETDSTVLVRVNQDTIFPVRVDRLTEEVKSEFVSAVNKIPGMGKNLSYVQLMGKSELYMSSAQVLAMLAIGKAIGVWSLFPQDFYIQYKSLYEKDSYGVLPIIWFKGESISG